MFVAQLCYSFCHSLDGEEITAGKEWGGGEVKLNFWNIYSRLQASKAQEEMSDLEAL